MTSREAFEKLRGIVTAFPNEPAETDVRDMMLAGIAIVEESVSSLNSIALSLATLAETLGTKPAPVAES
jgi:hypothetical protein